MRASQLQVGDVLAGDDPITAVQSTKEEDLLGLVTVITVTTAAGKSHDYTGDPWVSVRRGGRQC
jgi:hypothetical protein